MHGESMECKQSQCSSESVEVKYNFSGAFGGKKELGQDSNKF